MISARNFNRAIKSWQKFWDWQENHQERASAVMVIIKILKIMVQDKYVGGVRKGNPNTMPNFLAVTRLSLLLFCFKGE